MSCNTMPAQTNVVAHEKKEMQVSDTSDGWGGDVTLSILKSQKLENGKKILTVISSYKEKDVGFELQLSPQNKKNGFHETGITIKSLGAISDNLLDALGNIYSIKISPTSKFVGNISTTYVNLDELVGIETPDIKTKLFLGNPDKENEYGEIYLNIYEKVGTVELKEKDIEYRLAVIKAFSTK